MFRLVFIFVLLYSLGPLASAQKSNQRAPSATPTIGLTWEEIESRNPTYPFEAELNACILEDVRSRGIGEPCLQPLFALCPESSLERPGTQAPAMCVNYFQRYWRKRLGAAAAEIVAHYEENDEGEAVKGERVMKFKDMQKKWGAWRQAKCDFLLIQTSWRNSWTQLRRMSCVGGLTSTRALELELLRGLLIR